MQHRQLYWRRDWYSAALQRAIMRQEKPAVHQWQDTVGRASLMVLKAAYNMQSLSAHLKRRGDDITVMVEATA